MSTTTPTAADPTTTEARRSLLTTPSPCASTEPVVNPAPVSASTPAEKSDKPSVNRAEQAGWLHARKLHGYIIERKGKFLRDEDGELCVYIDGRPVLLNPVLASETIDLNRLLLSACDITSVTQEARIAIQRLQVLANDSCSDIRERHFAACAEDEKRIYIPIQGEMLLEISEAAIQMVPNVTNDAALWVKHPERAPFKYVQSDLREGLAAFERLLVEPLACKHGAMRWFVAMHEGLFPFVRDIATQRFLVTHEGGTQQGKTTGAQRFTLLHGLGDVVGDASVAALSNGRDVGLLVLDNKEQKNLNQALIDFCLFLCTGARRIRSSKDGSETHATNRFRPVGVITSIEGVYKAELAERNVPVEFCVCGQKIGREGIEREIKKQRNQINSALMVVLQKFLSIRNQHKTSNPFGGNFDAHFTALCDLLRAFGEVAAKPEGWVEKIITAWNRLIPQRGEEAEDSEYEYSIQDILYRSHPSEVQQINNVEINGRVGTLFKLQSGFLHNELKKMPGFLASLPKTPESLSKRLNAEKFRTLEFLREEDAPELLKRKNSSRFIGFFIEGDRVTDGDRAEKPPVTAPNL